jgi:hypothetical protein
VFLYLIITGRKSLVSPNNYSLHCELTAPALPATFTEVIAHKACAEKVFDAIVKTYIHTRHPRKIGFPVLIFEILVYRIPVIWMMHYLRRVSDFGAPIAEECNTRG